MRRRDCSADLMSLNARPRKVAREKQLRVRVVRCRTVANIDSMGFLVRRCCQCFAGTSRRPAVFLETLYSWIDAALIIEPMNAADAFSIASACWRIVG